jgi:hypothetical protein
MDGYLTKPFRSEELDALLEKWASERAAAHDVPANVGDTVRRSLAREGMA